MYKSNGRKQLESDAPGKIRSFALQSCHPVDALKAWFQSEFPNKTYEIIVSESDLEILKRSLPNNGEVEITATQSAVPGSGESAVSCTYIFANETTWKSYKEKFIEDLENNMMTSN